MPAEYTPSEMMIIAAARALAGVHTVFVGVGQPNIACNLARRTVAPHLELIYESGVFGARPARMPLSIGDPSLVTGSLAVCSQGDLFGLYLQGGRLEVALLAGAQVDRFGNLNTTVVGSYAQPKVRLPGSGGACEIAINAGQVFIMMALSKRTFVQQLDFRTSPGHLDGQGERAALGMTGAGPQRVITDKGLLGFDAAGEMVLERLHPGVTLDDVRANMGWEVRVSAGLSETAPPTAAELRILREELDPQGIYRR